MYLKICLAPADHAIAAKTLHLLKSGIAPSRSLVKSDGQRSNAARISIVPSPVIGLLAGSAMGRP